MSLFGGFFISFDCPFFRVLFPLLVRKGSYNAYGPFFVEFSDNAPVSPAPPQPGDDRHLPQVPGPGHRQGAGEQGVVSELPATLPPARGAILVHFSFPN
jgi:hypothetical protein